MLSLKNETYVQAMCDKCKLSVVVLVYNQEKTIAKTLDSILSQAHEYPYEIVVGDDVSTDGSRDVLQRYKDSYPDIIQLIYNDKNLGVVGNWVNALRHCHGEYIMECAPDDWWLPGKIERQIAFMDVHPEYGMCYGKVKRFSEKRGEFLSTLWGARCESFDDIIKNIAKVPPMSMCFRRELGLKYVDEIHPERTNWIMEDYPFYIWLIIYSRIFFDETILGVYRVVENSISHSKELKKKEKFYGSVIDVKRFWLKHTEKDYDEKTLEDEYNRYLAYDLLKDNRNVAETYLRRINCPNKKDRALILTCKYPFLYFCYLMYLKGRV